MSKTNRTSKDEKFRTCTSCGKILPNTLEYFSVNNGDGLNSKCKECMKEKSKNKREKYKEKFSSTKIEYDGEKICKKCGRSLPNSYRFFPVDKGCKTGLRNICRECNPKYRHFLSEDFEASKPWTVEEDELMRLHYNDHTGLEMKEQYLPERSIRAIESRAGILGISWKSDEAKQRARDHQASIVSEKMKGRTFSEESKQKLSETKKEYFKTHDGWWLGKKRSDEQRKQISERMKGKWAGDKNPRHIHPLNGAKNGRWKGGINQTYAELRSETKDWQKESMEFCGYHCVISGGEFDNVHHTLPFRDIVDEVFENTQIEVREKVMDYSEEEFERLRIETKQLHNYYGYGACIKEEIHKLFHDNYGYTGFNPHDFLDFVYRIDCGDFDKWFDENNISININYEYVEYLESVLFEIKSA